MSPKETLVERVQKLLALAESKNENEAALAAEKAQELMLRYGIELAQVAALKQKGIGVGKEEIQGRVDPWRRKLAAAVARSMGGQLVYWNEYRKWTGTLTFWGQKDTVAGMVALYQYLEAQLVTISAIEAAQAEHFNAAQSMRWRRSFLAGMVSRMRVRLYARRKAVQSESKDNSQALVVVKDAVEKAMEEAYGKMRKGRANNSNVDYGAYAKGAEAGERVDMGDGRLRPEQTSNRLEA